MLKIDGSQGEGGGSVLRLASALALIKQEPVIIENIRKKRPVPGLRPQHLFGLRALTEFCGGGLEGGVVGSESVTFHPNNQWKTDLRVNIPTAGSIGLVLQVLQIGMVATQERELNLQIEGGATFGKWAPSMFYIKNVTWEIFKKMGYHLEVTIDRHGFYPKGGASVKIKMRSPTNLSGINLKQDVTIPDVVIDSIATNHLKRARVAERQAESIQAGLSQKAIASKIKISYVEARNPGSGVLVYSKTGNTVVAGDSIGEKRKQAEKVGQIALNHFLNTLTNHCSVDPFLSDQLLPIMTLASTSSSFSSPKLTRHTQTNIDILKVFNDAQISTEKQNNNYYFSVDV
jgi:RNA 3'-terminal phosphate cyclase (ATP)/RNA 3'-terminal phosphate cyclase (GTP)